jgi:dynactin 1
MYLESDSDATNAYLFFQRIAFKADIINASVAQMNGLPESLNGTVTEGLVGTCDVIFFWSITPASQ